MYTSISTILYKAFDIIILVNRGIVHDQIMVLKYIWEFVHYIHSVAQEIEIMASTKLFIFEEE